MPQRFTFSTPQSAPIDPLVAALIRGGQGPARTNLEGLGRLAQTLSGALRERQLDVQNRQEQAQALRDLLASGGMQTLPVPDTPEAGLASDLGAAFTQPDTVAGPLQGAGFDLARQTLGPTSTEEPSFFQRMFGVGQAPSRAQLSLTEALIGRGMALQDAERANAARMDLFRAQQDANANAPTPLQKNLKAAGIEPGTPEYRAAVVRNITKPTAEVKLPGQNKSADTLGARFAEQLDNAYSAATSALDSRRTINAMREAAKSAFLGPGASARAFFNRVGTVLGIGGDDNTRLVATRNMIQGFADLVVGARGELKGQGQITEFEQKTLAKARSGDIDDLSKPEVDALLNVFDRFSANRISRFESIRKRAATIPALRDWLPAYELPTAEAEPATPSVTPTASVPNVGEIVDGYRFRGGDPADQNNWERVR